MHCFFLLSFFKSKEGFPASDPTNKYEYESVTLVPTTELHCPKNYLNPRLIIDSVAIRLDSTLQIKPFPYEKRKME